MKKVFNILLIVILLVIAIVEGIFLIKGDSKKEKEFIPNSHIVHTVKVLYPDKTISHIQKRFYVFDEKDVCISSMTITVFYHEDVYLDWKNRTINEDCHFDDENMIMTHTTNLSKMEYNSEYNKESIMSSLEPTSEYIISSSEIY